MYNYQNRVSVQSSQRNSMPLINENRYSTNEQNRVTQTKKQKQNTVYNNYQQKMKALGKVRYINQLAQMEYEQKLTQLHTKYSFKTKQSVQKKLRSKNQMAEFIEEEDQQLGQQFEQLMDYKYGSSKWKNFHYERQSTNKQYNFCSLCDQIHTGTQNQHQISCKYQQLAKSPLYYFQSLDRIKDSLKRLTSQQAGQLSKLTDKIKRSQNVSQQLYQILPIIKNDQVLGKIAAKLQQIIQQTQ